MNGLAPFLHVEDRGQLDHLIARASVVSHEGHVVLLRAVRDGVINVAFVDRSAEMPMKTLERARRPVVVVVGDDDHCSTGPTGLASWRRLKHWAQAGLIHATGADAGSYQLAVAMALVRPRMLLIETGTAHAQEWAEALYRHRIRAIGLLPKDGAHPILPARGEMQ